MRGSQRRVAVTGLGSVTPCASSPADFFEHLLAGKSAVQLYQRDDIPPGLAMPAVRCTGFDPVVALGRAPASMMDRYAQFGVAAATAAWRDAGLAREPQALLEAGVAWGTALGGALTFERGYQELFIAGRGRVSPLSVLLGMTNAAASHIAIALKLGGPCTTYSQACASSAIAIGEGLRQIRDGRARIVLAGGSEAPLAYGVLRAWEALRVLAPGDAASAARACRPFSADRAGLVLGEGGAALVLEDWAHAEARGARIYAELAGYGASCDACHLVRPDAAGQLRAMQAALADAALAPEDIGYVNAHGTATAEGDPTEAAALRELFGARAAGVPVSATKSMHGHMLGATGALEALITVLALARGAIPPTAHLAEVDPACAGLRHVTRALHGQRLEAALSNAFAFGGSNAVLAFRAAV